MHPILLRLQVAGLDVSIYSYGFVLGWALFFAAQTALHFGKRDRLEPRRLAAFSAGCIAVGYLGARILFLATDETAHHSAAELFALQYDGLAFYGGALAGTLAACPMARLCGLPLGVLDSGGPAMALALGLGRIGCFLYGCDYGLVTTGSWRWAGVSFPGPSAAWPEGSPAWRDQVRAHWIPADAHASLPVLPLQLVESALVLALAAALWVYLSRRPRQGSALLAFFFSYGVIRAALELLRGDSQRGELLGVSTSLAIGLLTSSAALALLSVPALVRLRPLRPDPPPAPPA